MTQYQGPTKMELFARNAHNWATAFNGEEVVPLDACRFCRRPYTEHKARHSDNSFRRATCPTGGDENGTRVGTSGSDTDN